jgi:type II secretory ATPase GspE/PulE/Tfp pilus assembly ATPase PilB-like protein
VHPNDNLARNSAATFLEEFRHEWVCISQGEFDGFLRHHLGEIFANAPEEEEETFHVQYHRSEGAIVPPATSPAADLLDQLLGKALDSGASDVHFEPDPDGVNVRARIDGRMTELHPLLEFEMYKQLVARVKVISELNLAERRLPQDASLRLEFRRRMIDMRVSTLPTPTGEAVVLRLLDPTKRNLDLSELIVENRVAELVQELFAYPSGLVLVTGPTGSGKTTTLYGGMRSRLAATPTIKLVTAEDPVEYELEGVSQVQVNTTVGLTYERILRSLLRQDPDVLLIGEMRDEESMQIGLEASLTGHLVLSSLHTNNALETIMRLRQRGAENYVIAASLRGIVSQRLVARLCAACARPAELDARTRDRLHGSGVLREGETLAPSEAPGCEVCRFLGRKGRVGLYEVLVMTDSLREAIEGGASYAGLNEAIPRSSYLPMRRYARHLLEKGLTAVEDMLPLFPSAKLREELDP